MPDVVCASVTAAAYFSSWTDSVAEAERYAVVVNVEKEIKFGLVLGGLAPQTPRFSLFSFRGDPPRTPPPFPRNDGGVSTPPTPLARKAR